MNVFARLGVSGLAVILTAALSGCSAGPSKANILLRKQNQTLTGQLTALQQQNAGLTAEIAAIQSRPGATTQQLPETRLENLFTVHGLSFGRLTGGFTDAVDGPDHMVKVYVVPTDGDGEPLKAAGAFKVELFDLAEKDTRLGTWAFPLDQARANWYGRAFLYTYVLNCPWQTLPKHSDLLLRVTFTDGLTDRQFTSDKQITVRPPN